MSRPVIERLTATVLSLRHNGAAIHRWAALGFIFVSVLVMIYRSVDHPRGILRRWATNHVAEMDAQRRAMFKTPIGIKIAFVQIMVVLVLLGCYGVIPYDPLLLLVAVAAFAPGQYLRNQLAARRAEIDNQAHGFALTLSNALRATASIGDALKGATDVTAAPLKEELGTVLRQVRVGSTIEEGLLALSSRVQSSALDVVVSALLIGRQTGGDLPRILEGTASSLRELKRLEEYTDKNLRGAKQAIGISAGMVVLIALGMPYFYPGFLDPLKNTTKGQIYTLQLLCGFFLALFLAYRFTTKSI